MAKVYVGGVAININSVRLANDLKDAQNINHDDDYMMMVDGEGYREGYR